MVNERYKKNPGKFGPKSVLGVYLRAMNMAQYRDLTFADSDKIGTEKDRKPIQTTDDQYEEELKQKLESGEITQEQYNTYSRSNYPQPSDFGGGLSIVDDEGVLSNLKGLDLPGSSPSTPADQPQESQEQTPQYQIDSNY